MLGMFALRLTTLTTKKKKTAHLAILGALAKTKLTRSDNTVKRNDQKKKKEKQRKVKVEEVKQHH